MLIMLFNTAVYMENAVISASRMISVVVPSKTRCFSIRNVKLILLLVSITSVLNSLLYYQDSCWIFFNSTTLLLDISNTYCGQILSFYGDFVFGVTIFTASFIMDIISIVSLRKMRKKVANTISVNMNKQRYHKELLMTVQVFINTTLCYIMLCSYHIFSDWLEVSPLMTFLTTNFLWCFVLASGGFTAIMLNNEIRRILIYPLGISLKKVFLTKDQAEEGGFTKPMTSFHMNGARAGFIRSANDPNHFCPITA
ncbi:hypothetical protein KIN20_021841 [Parelaphostrongylus tenuis]|nr:hypothetical protein KIN20_021841 [Parelaphostrongylus tenuis]